jgi:hypothetical protein
MKSLRADDPAGVQDAQNPLASPRESGGQVVEARAETPRHQAAGDLTRGEIKL